jgi:hypothetical protein
MKRIASRGAALAVMGTLAMSGAASAFTPVPIPKPQISGASAVAYGKADRIVAFTPMPIPRPR